MEKLNLVRGAIRKKPLTSLSAVAALSAFLGSGAMSAILLPPLAQSLVQSKEYAEGYIETLQQLKETAEQNKQSLKTSVAFQNKYSKTLTELEECENKNDTLKRHSASHIEARILAQKDVAFLKAELNSCHTKLYESLDEQSTALKETHSALTDLNTCQEQSLSAWQGVERYQPSCVVTQQDFYQLSGLKRRRIIRWTKTN